MAGTGGKRAGAGRKSKEINELKKNFAAKILTNKIEHEKWSALLQSKDPRVVLDALKHLGDHKHGKAKERHEHTGENGGPIPVSITIDRGLYE